MIYFIRDPASRCVKIGFSKNPAQRFNKLRVDCPNDVILVAVIEGDEAAENWLHLTYAHLHRRGEWFFERDELATFIAGLPRYVKPPGKRVGRDRKYSPTAIADWLRDNNRTDTSLAKEIGVSRACVSHIRRGIRQPSLPLAVRICQATGMSLNKFLKAA